MTSALITWLTDNFSPGVGIKPKDDWQNGEEGTDYLNLNTEHVNVTSMMQIVMDVATSVGLPGTQILVLLPLAAGALLIPLKWIIAGVEVSLWDIVFAAWLTHLMPIPSISIVGFGCPVPLGLIWYIISTKTGPEADGSYNFPILGDGVGFTLPHTGDATYFSGQTDGKWTWKDGYLDGFILWLLYKGGKHLGREIITVLVRVLLFAAEYRQAHVTDVLARIKDSGVTLNYVTGYDVQDGEKTINTLLDDTFDQLETESDTGKKSKEYIKNIKRSLHYQH
jgi:hypothetical protein